MKYLVACIVSMAFTGLATTSADASEWGCEVLLCAASSDPSWRGVASCHPPMEKLISAMKKPGFSWPTCPEGGADEPGYERYEECPTGWMPTAGQDGPAGRTAQGQSRCMRVVNHCTGHQGFRMNEGGREATETGAGRVQSSGNACPYIEYAPRPLRTHPYFFDIRDESTGSSSRFWFELAM